MSEPMEQGMIQEMPGEDYGTPAAPYQQQTPNPGYGQRPVQDRRPPQNHQQGGFRQQGGQRNFNGGRNNNRQGGGWNQKPAYPQTQKRTYPAKQIYCAPGTSQVKMFQCESYTELEEKINIWLSRCQYERILRINYASAPFYGYSAMIIYISAGVQQNNQGGQQY